MKKTNKVKILSSRLTPDRVGNIGVIVEESKRGEPYKVVFDDGFKSYFSPKSLKLVKE